MMDRRRALMGQAKTNHLLLSIYNREFVTGELILTDIAPFSNGRSVTILLDITIQTNPTSGDGRTWKLISVGGWAYFMIGKNNGTATSVSGFWQEASAVSLGGGDTSAGRFRFAVTHEADSDDIVFAYKKVGWQRSDKTLSGTFTPSNSVLCFGYKGEKRDHLLPEGAINCCEVYDIILDSAAINEFLS